MAEISPHAATLNAYFEGINQERYDDVAALFASDGELIAPGTGVRRGAEAIAAYLGAALAPYPEHLDDPRRVLASGDSATVELRFSGATADGVPVTFDAIDVFDFDADGRIRRLSSWYDSHAVRGQLGRAGDAARPASR